MQADIADNIKKKKFSTAVSATGLTPYTGPWSKKEASHLTRRTHFGTKINDVNYLRSFGDAVSAVEALVERAKSEPLPDDPQWFTNGLSGNVLDVYDIQFRWMDQMYNNGLTERMILFWSNHFVTRLEEYYSSNHLYEYYKVIEDNSFGNFQDFVNEIGKTSAMLIFLNGFENTAGSPNENYARELYELFTLGVDNGYTQSDIVETSKALTGYNHRNHWTAPITYNQSTFNTSDKTIFGQTGNWGYEDVINILFQERAPLIAEFVCRKLYSYFISATVNEDIVSDLAAIFIQDFNIANILRTLFKSEHFFDAKTTGTLIKSPYDMTMSYLKVTDFSLEEDYFEAMLWFNGVIGQDMFNPVDVAGWQGDRDWINSSTLGGRWLLTEWTVWHTWNNYNEELRTFAIESSNNSNDPFIVTKSIIDRFMPLELFSIEEYQTATDVFKFNVPQNYYDDGVWNLGWESAPYQIVLLLIHLAKIPEYQLK